MDSYYSHGKLLISGEYLVLDGALALGIPTRLGQRMSIEPGMSTNLNWTSIDEMDNIWYSGEFKISDSKLTSVNGDEISLRLEKILNSAIHLNPAFLNRMIGCDVSSKLEFNRDWGLGSSSTLINNIAQWANIDPFKLSDITLGGSGYDIACAMNDKPILYRRLEDVTEVKKVDFNPNFNSNLYFLYLGQKQDSREAIKNYRRKTKVSSEVIDEISEISLAIAQCEALEEFQFLMEKHEQILSNVLDRPGLKVDQFSDFGGSIKSLGAWGGDFALVATYSDPLPYFNNRGYSTLIPYEDMILK